MKDVAFQSKNRKEKLGKYLDCELDAWELTSMLRMIPAIPAACLETTAQNLVAAICLSEDFTPPKFVRTISSFSHGGWAFFLEEVLFLQKEVAVCIIVQG